MYALPIALQKAPYPQSYELLYLHGNGKSVFSMDGAQARENNLGTFTFTFTTFCILTLHFMEKFAASNLSI